MNDKRIIIFAIIVLSLWSGAIYIIAHKTPEIGRRFFNNESKVDSLLKDNNRLENEVLIYKNKSDSLIALLNKKDKRIKTIKIEDHEKNIFIDSLSSSGLYDFFAKYQTR